MLLTVLFLYVVTSFLDAFIFPKYQIKPYGIKQLVFNTFQAVGMLISMKTINP